MPSLILNSETVSARLSEGKVEVIRRGESGEANDFVRIYVPLFDIDRVVVCGRADITTPLLQKFMLKGIPVYFVTSHGRWIGALSPDRNMNAARRIRQYELYKDADFSLKIAKRIVHAKVRNCRRVLQRLSANRKESFEQSQQQADRDLKELAEAAIQSESMETLRGYEGYASSIYFERLGKFFPENIPFRERTRRPPKDPANALLSWTYTIVFGEIDAAVRTHGLDPCIGFLHSLSYGTPSLSLDLLEPLRAPCCDLLTLHLLNHKILNEESFRFDADTGGFYLIDEAKKQFFFSYEIAMTRKFMLKKGMPHTDFRKVIEQNVIAVLHAMEGKENFSFFYMP